MRACFIQLNALDVAACDLFVEPQARFKKGRATKIYSGKVITGSHDLLVNLHDIAKMEVAEIRAYDMREQFKRLKQGPVAEEMAGFKVKYTSANSLVPDTLTFTDNEAIPKDIESCQKWAGEELFRATKKQLGVITLQSAVATGLGINGVRYSDQIIYVKPWTIEQIKEELKLQLQLEAVIIKII